MKLTLGLSSFSWTLMITVALLLISDAELQQQRVDPGVLLTNTSQYQCVIRHISDNDFRNGELKVVDRVKGIVVGTFYLNPSVKQYKILLHWLNDTSDERCNNKSQFSTYMDLKLTPSKCLHEADESCGKDSCKKVVEVSFRYIVSGCYNFEVTQGRSVKVDSYNVLETDFQISKLKNPNCDGVYQREIFNLSFSADIENMIFDDTARLKVCFLESRNESLCSSQNMFLISMNGNATDNKQQKLKHSYNVRTGSIFIRFVNISLNVSSIFLFLENDIRCSNSENLFYQTFCHLVISLDKDCKEVKIIASPHLQEVHNDYYGVLLPLLSLPLILIASLIIAKRIFCKNSLRDTNHDLTEGSKKLAHSDDNMDIQLIDNSNDKMVENTEYLGYKSVKKIILAYSQDCQEFMEVMEAFRIFLRDVMKFEVFDCFDSDLFALTALDKYSWIDRLIRCQDTGVILVETPLTVIIDQIITKRRVHVKYSNPTMFSDAFIYIMKQIRNSNTNSYDKMAVIRFDEYTDEQFKLLDNKFVRFSVPTNLQELCRHFSKRHESPTHFESCMEIKRLKSCLAKLAEFRAKNTNHLQSIIIL